MTIPNASLPTSPYLPIPSTLGDTWRHFTDTPLPDTNYSIRPSRIFRASSSTIRLQLISLTPPSAMDGGSVRFKSSISSFHCLNRRFQTADSATKAIYVKLAWLAVAAATVFWAFPWRSAMYGLPPALHELNSNRKGGMLDKKNEWKHLIPQWLSHENDAFSSNGRTWRLISSARLNSTSADDMKPYCVSNTKRTC